MKNLKNKILILLFAIFLSIGNIAWSEEVQPSDIVKDAANSKTEIQTRLPYSKRALAMKFLIAMLGVGASSIMIYVLLTIYNRFLYGTAKYPDEATEDDDYKTPTNMKDALGIFFRKTK